MKSVRLSLEMLWRRRGPMPILGALLLIVGCVLNFVEVPRIEAARARAMLEYERGIAALNQPGSPAQTSVSLLEQRHAHFLDTLAVKDAAPDLLKRVFTEARKQGVTLTQAEYRLSHERSGGFYAYQMVLPVKGAYPKLREFIDRVLEGTPNAALDDIAFKRDGIGAASADARLRFVFFLKDART